MFECYLKVLQSEKKLCEPCGKTLRTLRLKNLPGNSHDPSNFFLKNYP